MTDKMLKDELRIYSERYYAKHLEEAGFLNYRKDLLNWYRISNGVICHFHILSAHSRLPMLMFVWLIHPTYVATNLNFPASYNRYDDPMLFYAHKIGFQSHLVEPGGGINVPNLPQRGAERLFEEFFPMVEPLQTRESVHKFWKEEILTQSKNPRTSLFNLTKPDFADEALMMQDSEMYAPCIENIKVRLARKQFSHLFSRSPELLKAQLKALQGENVDQYLSMLKERKASFLKRYKLQDDAFDL